MPDFPSLHVHFVHRSVLGSAGLESLLALITSKISARLRKGANSYRSFPFRRSYGMTVHRRR
jgi:hypothetical protein